ncbi:YciI family protein [Bradyrhizobium yuanmingense]|nr:YciI family protein [Bradyrhizobium yuanmingense]
MKMSFGAPPVRLVVGNTAEHRSEAMQYLLMIYQNEIEYAKIDAATSQKILAEYQSFTQDIIQSGNFKAGDRLQPTTTATTVRVRDGKTLTTDGPFAETREQLGGYYLIEAKDLNAAIEIAARIPSARIGSIEVRPIWVYDK